MHKSGLLNQLKPTAVSLALILATGFFKMLLNHLFQIESPILLFFTAIALASWYGGAVQGIFATVFSYSFILYMLASPGMPAPGSTAWVVRLALYFFDGLVISLVCAELRRSRNQLQVSEDRF